MRRIRTTYIWLLCIAFFAYRTFAVESENIKKTGLMCGSSYELLTHRFWPEGAWEGVIVMSVPGSFSGLHRSSLSFAVLNKGRGSWHVGAQSMEVEIDDDDVSVLCLQPDSVKAMILGFSAEESTCLKFNSELITSSVPALRFTTGREWVNTAPERYFLVGRFAGQQNIFAELSNADGSSESFISDIFSVIKTCDEARSLD